MNQEIDTGVVLPEDGQIDVAWARTQLERTDAFSKELMYFGKASVFFMLKTNLSESGYNQAVQELDYTVETAEVYINYLQLRPVLEAIKAKYYVALSLSAAEYLPESIEEALALCDIVVAKYGKITADNLVKALKDTGKSTNKLSDAAITVEATKKQALMKWLLEEHSLTESEVQDAQQLHPEGKNEFNEKAIAAFDRLGDWKVFYNIIADTVHNSGNSNALRFLADMDEASGSIMEYLKAEEAYNNLNTLKDTFESTVYPEILYQASK